MHGTEEHAAMSDGATETLTILRHERRTPSGGRWETVFTDPALRRLLRNGHQAEATAFLLEQLVEGG
jgi:hypothetical protein